MSRPTIKLFNKHVKTGLLLTSIIFILFFCWRDIFGYFFTAKDSFTLIETSRIESTKDIARIFSEPLMNKTKFINKYKYYRPIACLSYSLDYAIWKLNPLGYHLTDFLLHLLVTILVFFFIRLLLNGEQFIAWLSAVVFAIHPTLVEVGPATARRHDILAALFILVSLILFIKQYLSIFHKKTFACFSIFFYAFALGAKEIAIILPLLIWALIFFSLSKEMPFTIKMLQAFKRSFAFFFTTLLWLAWRFKVLHGLGGEIHGPTSAKEVIILSIRITRNFILDLIYPVDYLRTMFTRSTRAFEFGHILFFATVAFLLLFLIFLKRSLLVRIRTHIGVTRILMCLLVAGIILSLITVLVYPSVTLYVGSLVKFKDLVYESSFFSAFLCSICLVGTHLWSRLNNLRVKKAAAYFIIWTFLPLIVFLVSLNFAHRSMYISIIPLSAVLSIMFYESFPYFFRPLRKFFLSNNPIRLSSVKPAIGGWLIITGTLASLLAYSPIFRTYGEWKDSGEISREFLSRLLEITDHLPNDAILQISNLPSGISSYRNKITALKDVTYLDEYSIESWLKLHNPAVKIKIVVRNVAELPSWPCRLRLDVEMKKDNLVKVNVDCEGS